MAITKMRFFAKCCRRYPPACAPDAFRHDARIYASLAVGDVFGQHVRFLRGRYLVALAPTRDLLLSAKHLFVEANCTCCPTPSGSIRTARRRTATRRRARPRWRRSPRVGGGIWGYSGGTNLLAWPDGRE